jgi:hypothetical protein
MRAGRSVKEIANFLPSWRVPAIVFQKDGKPSRSFSCLGRPSAQAQDNDSEMAPQAIEIAENGLGSPAWWSLRGNRSGEFGIRACTVDCSADLRLRAC